MNNSSLVGNLNGVLAGLSATTYTVKKGDTLYAIANKYGTTITVLASANHISEIDSISVGQHLLIPGGAGVALPKDLDKLLNPANPNKSETPTKIPIPLPSNLSDWFNKNQTTVIGVGALVLVLILSRKD